MKTPSKDLFRLISSLTAGEKTFFRKFVNMNSEKDEKVYIKLYGEIEKQAEKGVYDEEAIKEKFKDEKFINQLHVTKNYLYNLILKSLGVQHLNSSVKDELLGMISSIHELYRKELYGQCEKLIMRAKAIATENEYFPELVRIMDYELLVRRKVYHHMKRKSDKYVNDDLYEGIDEIVTKIKNFYEYDRLLRRISGVHFQKIKLRTEKEINHFKKIDEEYLMRDERHALSYRAKISFYFAKTNFYSLIEDRDKDFEYSKRHLAFMDAHPKWKAKEIERYISMLNNMMISCYETKRFKDYRIYLKRIEDLYSDINKRELKRQRSNIYRVYFIHYMLIMFLEEKFEDKKETILELESRLGEFEPKISKIFAFNIYYFLSQYFFIMKDYGKALYYNNIIINNKEAEKLQQFYAYNLYLSLLIHFELKNYELVDHLGKNIRYYLKKAKSFNKTSKLFLGYFNKLINTSSPDEERDIFANFKMEKKKLESELTEGDPMRDFYLYDYWIESKIG